MSDAIPDHYAILPWLLGPAVAVRYMTSPRPFVTSMQTGPENSPRLLTQADLMRRRLAEHASAQALLLRVGLPIFVTWNQVQEQHIADTEKHGHIEVGRWDELRVAVVSIAPSMLYSYGVGICETCAAMWLLREGGGSSSSSSNNNGMLNFRKNLVFESELPMRLWPHYVGNVLESWWLPRRWSLLGEPPSKAEVSYFESKVSFACAFEDSLKRHTLSTVANCVIGTIAHLSMLSQTVRNVFATRLLQLSKKEVKKQHRDAFGKIFGNKSSSSPIASFAASSSSSSASIPVYVWTERPAPTLKEVFSNIGWQWTKASVELVGGALCGAAGTWIDGGRGGSAEYWMTMVPWFGFAAYSAVKAMRHQYSMLKEQIGTHSKLVEEQEKRTAAQRQQQQQQQQQQQEQQRLPQEPQSAAVAAAAAQHFHRSQTA